MSKVEAWLKFEARRQPMLWREEERDFARRARAGDQKAVTCLVGSHLRLIIWVAERYGGPGSAKADLVQEGCVGLMQALHRFNPDKGARFSMYSIWWIKAAIQEHAMRSWSLVRIGTTSAQKILFFNLRRLRAVLNETGDSLSDKGVCSVARMLRVSQRDVRPMELRFVGPG
ncbi:MAG: sigma-70 family RNA polymerase sigma factor [Alphaproteobacteria bacterium]